MIHRKFALLALIAVNAAGCATTKHREPSMEVLGHECVSGGMVIRIAVQADDPGVLTLAVPDGLCGDPT